MKKILIYCLVYLLISSCSKDLGNYKYKDINNVKIDSVLSGTHPLNRVYSVSFGKEVSIKPQYEGTLSGEDLSNIEFTWKVDGEVVSTDKELHYKADKKFGKLFGELKIIDKSTSISTSYNFFINVVNVFKSGYYFLAKDQSNKALLYCMTEKSRNFDFNKIGVSNVPDLGKNPIHISGYKKYYNSDVGNIIFIGVQNAQYPIMQIDSREFLATTLYSNSSFSTGVGVLAPTQVWGDAYNDDVVQFVNDGKLFSVLQGIIPYPKFRNDPLDYHIAANGLFRPSFYYKAFKIQENMVAFYDDKNKTIRVLTVPSRDGFNYSISHDDKIDKSLLEGQEFLFGSYNVSTNSFIFGYTFITSKDNMLSLYNISYDRLTDTLGNMVKVGSVGIPNGQKISHYYYDDEVKCYYLSIGRTIYRMQLTAINGKLELTRLIDLPPTQTGDISTFEVKIDRFRNENVNLMVIVTEDKAKPDKEKSSIYIYSIADFSLVHSLENVLESVVGVYVGVLEE